jgi:hypothetical protein
LTNYTVSHCHHVHHYGHTSTHVVVVKVKVVDGESRVRGARAREVR